MYYPGFMDHQRLVTLNFALYVKLTYGCTLVRTRALCAVPPHSNTQPVLLVVLQSLVPQHCLMNVVSGST